MPADYAVTCDPGRDLLHVSLSGFFDPSELAGFDAARRAAHARLRCPPHRHVTLIGVSGLKLQAQDVVEAFRAMLAEPGTRGRRLAFVTGDSLARMQARRLMERGDIRCFPDRAAAEAWLAGSDAQDRLAG